VTTPSPARVNSDRPDIARAVEREERGVAEAGRTVALLAILGIAGLWLQHHLGFEVEKLGAVALAGVVWTAMGKLADFLDEKSAMGRVMDSLFKTPLRRLARYLTRTGPLFLIGGIVALVITMISSVTVTSETPGERSAVTLASLDPRGAARGDTLSRDKPLVRFLPVVTSPFGRLYEVDAEGYVPTQVTVYPLVGRRMALGRDLAPSPSVLFRPFGEGVVALEDGAVFSVSRLRDGRAEQLAVSSDSGAASSFLLGQRKPIADATMVFWTLEAAASGAPEPVRAKLLVTWRTPKQLPMRGELGPRDCLLAEIRLHGRLKERAMVPLTGASFVDVLMHEDTTDTPKVRSC
jgi:hypothetical protein